MIKTISIICVYFLPIIIVSVVIWSVIYGRKKLQKKEKKKIAEGKVSGGAKKGIASINGEVSKSSSRVNEVIPPEIVSSPSISHNDFQQMPPLTAPLRKKEELGYEPELPEQPTPTKEKEGISQRKRRGEGVAPIDRVGKPRGLEQKSKQGRNSQAGTFRLKAEIICRKRERQWMVIVELPEAFSGNSNVTVFQNMTPLTKDHESWPLEQVTGNVVVRWNEADISEEKRIVLGEENYLLFKISGQNQNQGRRVKFLSTGIYLVITPDSWELDQSLVDLAPAAPESVSLIGYQAHFFIIDRSNGGRIAFRTKENKPISIETKEPSFELIGQLLNDADKNKGPLFGINPPQIRALSDKEWMNVREVVIGEEGEDRSKWRKVFNPEQGVIEQNLPPEIVERKTGWYFLRFYDINEDLIESLDFRFIQALRAINIHQFSPLPSNTGHQTVSVELVHDPCFKVQPIKTLSKSIQIEYKNEKTILGIPPNPVCDRICCLVDQGDGAQMELHILVERIWWAIGPEDKIPHEWKDKCLALSRIEFTPTSNKAIWIRFPHPRWIRTCHVGFEQVASRCFTVKVAENMIVVPFREFADTYEITERAKDQHLKIWIQYDDKLQEGTLVTISADSFTAKPNTEIKLNPVVISRVRLVAALTRLCRRTRGPLRVLLKEVRREYYRGYRVLQVESVEFVKKGFCVIAIYLELCEGNHSQPLWVKKLWITRARVAREKYPDTISFLKDRYKALTK